MKNIILIVFALFTSIVITNAQSKDSLNKLASEPKKTVNFPIEYSILLPSLNVKEWDRDYNYFLQFLNDKIMRTQLGMSYKKDSVHYWAIATSAKPHAQLDTNTTITDLNKVQGVWRAICYRSIQFKDSASILAQTIYRTNKLIDENNDDDALLIFDKKEIRLYVKEKSKTNFKKKASAKYEIENGRYLLAYKLFKAGGNVSLIGIDNDGHLIINNAAVLEDKIIGNYINYYANIEQIIFEKIQ